MTKNRPARQYTVIVKNVVVVIVTFVRDVLKIVAICIIIIVFFFHRPALASPPPRATYIEASISQSENNPANLKVMLQVQAEATPSPSAQIALLASPCEAGSCFAKKATASVSSLALGSEKRSSREAVPAESLKNLPSVLLRNSLPIPKVDEIVPSALEDTSPGLAPEQQGLAPEITSLPRLSGGGSIELSPGGSSFTRPQRTPSLINRRPSSTTFLAAHTSQQSFISESGDRGRRPESQSSSSVFAPQRNTRLQRSMSRSEFRRRLCPCLPCFRGTDLQNSESEVVYATLTDGKVTSTNRLSSFLQERRQEGILKQEEILKFYSALEKFPSTTTGEVQLKYVRTEGGKMEVRLQASADSHYGCKVIQDVAKTVFGDKFKRDEYEIEHVRGSRGAFLHRDNQPTILIRKSMHRAMTNELKETSKLPYDFSATSDTAIDGLARQYKEIHDIYYDGQTKAKKTLGFPRKHTQNIIDHAFELTKKKEQELLENNRWEQSDYIPSCVFKQLSDYIDNGLSTLPQLSEESNTRQILEKVKRTRSQLETGLQALTHLSGSSSDNLKESIKLKQEAIKHCYSANAANLSRRYSDPAEKQEFQLRSNSWEKLSPNPTKFQECLEEVDFLGHRNKVNLNLFTEMKNWDQPDRTLFP